MTGKLKPEVVCSVGAEHGEGPLWHPTDRRLDWTDLAAGRLHRFDPATGGDEVIEVGSPLGAFAPREQGGFVLAVKTGFAFLDPRSGQCELVAPVDYGDDADVRMNDGLCDPAGRFWAGTMAEAVTPGRGALYRLDPDLSVTEMLTGVTISNGMDWSDDGTVLYYIDSLAGQGVRDRPTSGVDAFDFDVATGSISGRRRAIDIPNEPGGPATMTNGDGMTLDAEGFIWVAIWGAGEVRRYSPAGALDTVVEMPVACPTSVAFGGDDLRDLYITTMTLELGVPAEYRTHEAFSRPRPDEGALFRCRPGVRGRPPRAFAG